MIWLPDTITTPYIWSQMETATAILCASLVTYRPLFKGLRFEIPKYFISRSKDPFTSSGDASYSCSARGSGMKWAPVRGLQGPSLDPYHNTIAQAGKRPHMIDVEQAPAQPRGPVTKYPAWVVNTEDMELTNSRGFANANTRGSAGRPLARSSDGDISMKAFV